MIMRIMSNLEKINKCKALEQTETISGTLRLNKKRVQGTRGIIQISTKPHQRKNQQEDNQTDPSQQIKTKKLKGWKEAITIARATILQEKAT